MDSEYHREFTNIHGERIRCTYVPLTKREARVVEYTALGTIMSAVSSASEHFSALFMEVTGDLDSVVHVSKAVAAIYEAVPAETIEWLAERVLKGAIIQGPDKEAKINNVNETDYFDDRLDDFVLAIFWGLDVSFPRTFSKARSLANRLGVKRPGETGSKGSDTASTKEQPKS